MERDVLQFDVLIIGAGPAGLAAAIRIKQLDAQNGRNTSVCVLEKAASFGAHQLSGAVVDTRALDELIPDWLSRGAPAGTPVTSERFWQLGSKRALSLPTALMPPLLDNHGCRIMSLGKLCEWLAGEAEALGVDLFAGFSASAPVIDEQGKLRGVITGDAGLDRHGQPKAGHAPGVQIEAAYTLVAEGSRGSLTRELETRFELRRNADPQQYGLGLKELWQIAPDAPYQPGTVWHTLGWPLTEDTGGGGFVYQQEDGLVAVGFVVHLNYRNPYLNPYEEFQRFKTHPLIAGLLAGGKRIAYGARAITEGGIQSLPQLAFPGGVLIGCAAGFVNVPRIKGIHNALKSGMLAAEAAHAALGENRSNDVLASYPAALCASWIWQDLDAVRNTKPMLSRWGTKLGTLVTGAELWLAHFGVRLPWTLHHRRADHQSLLPASACQPIDYPKPDGKLSFTLSDSLMLANLIHDEDQPCHLVLSDPQQPVRDNLPRYAAPETRYCPAGVYEIVQAEQGPRLQINAANCLHCKTCDIKDPGQNITWHPPEGGSGPNYSGM